MEMKLSLHINDDLQKTVITNVMTLVCHNNVRSIIMNIFWLSFEWNQFEYIGYGYNLNNLYAPLGILDLGNFKYNCRFCNH